jgi:hypothetical protein
MEKHLALNLLDAENPYERLDGWFKVDFLIKIVGFNYLKKN